MASASGRLGRRSACPALVGRTLTLLLAAVLSSGEALGAARKAVPDRPVLPPATASDRILVVAPHIDDEAIAAAGYLADALKRQAQVYVVYMTAGDANRTSARLFEFTLGPSKDDYLKIGHRRIREARLAMARLGLPAAHLFLLGYPDRGLEWMLENPEGVLRSPGTGRTSVPYAEALSPGAEHRLGNLQADLRQVLHWVRPTIVLLPVDFDAHSDHSASGRIVLPLLAETGDRPRALGYLVHAREFPRPFLPFTRLALNPPKQQAERPWAVFPLSRAQEEIKGRVLSTYRSQRVDPYLLLLTNAFIRRNELFLPLDSGTP